MAHEQAKLAPPLIVKVTDKLRLGNYRVTAFALVDVPKRTWSEWIKVGKAVRASEAGPQTDHQKLCVRLLVECERAEAEAMSAIVEDVRATDDDRVKMTFLERRYNKYFTRNPNSVIDDETGDELDISPREVLADKIAALVARRLEGGRDG